MTSRKPRWLPLLVVFSLFVLGVHSAYAQERTSDSRPVDPGIAALLAEFSGEAESKVRTQAEFQTALRQVVAHLIRGLAAEKIEDRAEPHGKFERICNYAARPGGAADREALCRVICERLSDEDTPAQARACMVRNLIRIGGAESVQTLAGLLADQDERIRELARRALEVNPARPAREALVSALRDTSDTGLCNALLNALGARGEVETADAVVPFVDSTEPSISLAALSALGQLGGREAIDRLIAELSNADAARRTQAGAALLRIAQRDDTGSAALGICNTIWETHSDAGIRRAALCVLAEVSPQDALAKLRELALGSQDSPFATAAVELLRDSPTEEAGKVLRGALKSAESAFAVIVLTALGDRGEHAAAGDVAERLDHDDESVRMAAVRATALLGGADQLAPLAAAAGRLTGREREAARNALARLRGDAVDAALPNAIDAADGAVRAELVRTLGARRTPGCTPKLLSLAVDPDAGVRIAAFDSLAILAEPQHLQPMLDRLLVEKQDSVRSAAEDALVSAANRLETVREASGLVLRRLSLAEGGERVAIVNLLARLQSPAGLDSLRSLTLDADDDVRDAAIRGLARWDDAAALPDLSRTLQAGVTDAQRALLLRGYVRLVRRPSERSDGESFDLLRSILPHARRPEERTPILAALGELRDLQALAFAATAALEDPDVREEAALAAASIARRSAADDETATLAQLARLNKVTLGEAAAKQLEETRTFIEDFRGYVAHWLVAGPYFKEHQSAEEVFKIEFEPEQPIISGVEWKPLSAAASDNPWMFDLTRVDGGHNRCIYLRAQVRVDQETPARLEIGVDDGVKVWLNSDLVHEKMKVRPVKAREDLVPVTLKRGWNDLKIKVVQGAGGWGVICGIRDPQGRPLEGLKFRAE